MEHFNHDVFRGPRLTLPVLVIALCVLFATAVPGRAATSITFCPFIIATPGNYELTTDLTCGSAGILINASGVSLKLNGHTITGGSTYGIWVFPQTGRLDHVTIEGPGLIRNFDFGISVVQTDYAQVALVTSARNGEGLVTNDCNYLTVGSSAFVGNSDIGVAFQGSNSVFQYNDLSGNGEGIAVLTSATATVNNNTANGNRVAGIFIQGNNSRVFANVTNGNGTVGIQVLTPTSGNQIFNNTSSVGNGTFDLEDDNPLCGSTLWNNNVFFTRSRACIR